MAKARACRDRDIVAELSTSWVESLAGQLTQAGRRLEGGWPGTLSDARQLLARRLASKKRSVSRAEFDGLVKALYEGARSRWLEVAERSPALPVED